MIRKFFSLLVAILAISLAGCGNSDQRVHITFWQGVNPPANREVLNRLIDKFNQSQNEVFVESIYAGQPDQQIPKILAAVVGNAAPDLLWFNPTLTGRLVELGAIRALDDLIENSPILAELDPALLPTMQYAGKYWSVPLGVNNIALYYRPSLLEQAGIKKLPETWADLQATAQKLSQNGNYGLLLPFGKGEFTVFMWTPFLWSAGGELLKGDRPQLQTPEAVHALSFWQELVKSGSALLSQPERGYEEDNFFSGKVAMQLSGSWALNFISSRTKDFGVMPLPRDRTPATGIGGENVFLFKSNPNREKAAWKFMEYIASAEFQTEWAIQTGYLPTNIRSQQSDVYRQYMEQRPEIRVFLHQMTAGRTRPLIPEYPRLSNSLGRAIEAVLALRSTPEQALAQAQASLDY
ncbi:MAG: ABC transporter substrate-binding protein [Pseudanabaenaceae cyanobacterium]